MGSLKSFIVFVALMSAVSAACVDGQEPEPPPAQWHLQVASLKPAGSPDRELWLMLKNTSPSVSMICWSGWAVHYVDNSELRLGKVDSCEDGRLFAPIIPGATVVFRIDQSQLQTLRDAATGFSIVFSERTLLSSINESREIHWSGSLTEAAKQGQLLARGTN